MSQNSQKTTLPSTPGESLELSEGSAKNLQVLRPGMAPGVQLPQSAPNQQLGQGIVPPNMQPDKPFDPNQQAEEISTFFRNRQTVVQGTVAMNPVLRFFLFTSVVMGSFILAWNYVGQFRKKSQSIAEQYLGISLADYVPVWTKRAKKFERHMDREIAARPMTASTSGVPGFGPIDPLYMAVAAGLWPQVDSHLRGKCQVWGANSDCSLKAWLLANRGSKSVLRPIAKLSPVALKSLTIREQAVLKFASATAMEGSPSTKLFQDVMGMLQGDYSFRRMIFDARFKQVLRENRRDELAVLVGMAKNVSTTSSDVSRWRALDLSTRFASASVGIRSSDQARGFSTQIGETIQKHPGSFKSDPLAFIPIANMGLTLGLGRQVSAVAGPLASESLKLPMDPNLRRDLFVIAARSLMLTGDSAGAADRLLTVRSKDGLDGVSSHLLGSILLEMRSRERLPDAIAAFQSAVKFRNTWQSWAGLLVAYVRAGNLKEAARTAVNLQTFKNKTNADWIDVVIAEFRLAKVKSSGGGRDQYKEIAAAMMPIYNKHPQWSGLANLYTEALTGAGQMDAAQKVRMSMDDMSTKTSYLSSSEFMASPIGPLGLMR